jgi:hypothetical protein
MSGRPFSPPIGHSLGLFSTAVSASAAGQATSRWDALRLRIAGLDRTIPDRTRERVSNLVLLAAATVSAALILYLGRHLTFFHDEWSFLSTRTGWSLDDFMLPHNEHWALGLAIPWKILLATVGLRSHLPYLALMIGAHLIAAGAVYVLVRTQAGRAIGVVFTVVFLFLGAAGENLFWAFQAGFIGSSAAGAWALALLLSRGPHERRANIAIAVLLVVAVATHGPGLFFLGAAGLTIAAISARRSQWPVLVPATVIYAVWYLVWGRSGVDSGFGASLLMPELLADYVRTGLSTALGNILGVGADVGLIATLFIVAAAAWRYVSTGSFAAGAVAGASGMLIQFLAQGIARATDGPQAATAPRYAYVVAIFAALAIASLLPRPSLSRPLVSHRRLVAVVAVAAILPLGANVMRLGLWAESFRLNTLATRAHLELATQFGGTGAVPWDARSERPELRTIPNPAVLNVLFAQYGSPLADPRVSYAPVPDEIRDSVLFDLVRLPSHVVPVNGVPDPTSSGASLPQLLTKDLKITRDGACALLRPSGGDPQVVMAEPGGWWLHVQGRPADQLELYLSLSGEFSAGAMSFVTIGETGMVGIAIPDLGPGVAPFLRVDPAMTGDTTVCAAAAPPPITGSGSGSASPTQ